MRALFVKRNCPYCREAILAVSRLNTILPLDEKIPIISIESGDTRLRLLHSTFGDEVKVTCLLLDRNFVNNRFGQYVNDRVGDIFVFSVLDREHMYYLLKNLTT